MFEQNPLCSNPLPSEDAIPDHCRPLSPELDGSEDPSLTAPEASSEDRSQEDAAVPEGQDPPCGPSVLGHSLTEAAPQYTSESLKDVQVPGDMSPHPQETRALSVFAGELHRISVCYGSGKGEDDAYTFSDDQSSCQVTWPRPRPRPMAPPPPGGGSRAQGSTLCCVCRTTAARTGRWPRTA